jgi:hypothetical protein
MATSPDRYGKLSPSTHAALGWAAAAACNRAQRAEPVDVEPADILVGLLLSHARPNGEARVLLSHFGLTARDVLPEAYPLVSGDELQRYADGVSATELPPLSPIAGEVLGGVERLRGGSDVGHLRHLLGSLLSSTSELTRPLDAGLLAAGASLSELTSNYQSWLASGERGATLGQMLERAHPRRPVDLPAYAADVAGAGADLVGVGAEVDAFAYLLASRALQPPLAVGLFGDWGSGKSFFMRAVRGRLESLTRRAATQPDASARFWPNVKQIEFNAWEYVRGDLWASLLDHIFSELGPAHVPLVAKRREELEGERDRAIREEQATGGEEERLEEERRTRAEALADAEQARAEQAERAPQVHDEQLARRATDALRGAWGTEATARAGSDAQALMAALADARHEVTRGRGLLGSYWTARRIVVATLAALAVGALVVALDAVADSPAAGVLGAIVALVPLLTGLLRSATGWSRERLDEIEAADIEIRQQLAAEASLLDQRVLEARAQLEESEARLREQRDARTAARERAAGLEQELAGLTPSRVLAEFLQERSRAGDYRRHLGLLATVKQDLESLEQLVRESNRDNGGAGPDAPPNRIVLYIDDLDRCPSAKVVEVLEAVHLLLAFELFVVVVAVDSRWLSFSLTDELKALVPDAAAGPRPTPGDYLEKIFQVPFWVRPLSADGRRTLVHGLLEGSVRVQDASGPAEQADGRRLVLGADGRDVVETMLSRRGAELALEAHALAITPGDLAFIEGLAPLLGETPRRVKRFVNTVQLLLAMRPTPNPGGPEPTERQLVAFVAALHAGAPQAAKALFAAAEAGAAVRLADHVAGIATLPGADRLQAWLADHPAWADLPVQRLAVRLDLVRRFSFTS